MKNGQLREKNVPSYIRQHQQNP